MKRFLAILCAVFMTALLFAGCGSKADTNVLRIGTEIGYPPFEMFDTDGKTPIGLDIDLGKEIGTILGREVEFIDTAFDTILQGLGTDKYDIVMSAVTITGERAQTVDFSTPYIENWQSIVVLSGTEPITSPQELEGKKVAYQKGTTSTKYLTDLIDTGVVSCTVSEFDKVLQCFDELRLGRVDAVLCDSVVSDGYVEREPGTFELTWVQSSIVGDEPELFGIAVKKDNTELLNAVNAALAQLQENGRLDEIRQEWLS